MTRYLVGSGCLVGTGDQAVSLDVAQARIAATIAGVAVHDRVPRRALVVAYATALQESHLRNLDYGTLDSVGVFQQRPSQGWGSTRQLENPVYATTKFFAALVRVPGYQTISVAAAAQAVQRSADGAAYGNYVLTAQAMAGSFTGQPSRAVWCWYQSTPQARDGARAAGRAMTAAFGSLQPAGVTVRYADPARSGAQDRQATATVGGDTAAGWTVAAWLVTHAGAYGLTDVTYDGYAWSAANGDQGWRATPPTRTASILLH